MGKKLTAIHFVTWPNGNIVEGSQTSVAERYAIGQTIKAWLIDEFFPGLDVFAGYSPARDELWKAMQKAGFKAHAIELPVDVASGVSR